MASAMSNYEQNFERAESKSMIISELIEQIVLVDEVIRRHRKSGTEGLILDQYLERKIEFSEELNRQLADLGMKVVAREAA
jgi:hypothetical protein